MLFHYDETIFKQILSKQLTSSQISFIAKQGLQRAKDFLLLMPKQYHHRQYDILFKSLKENRQYTLIGRIRQVSKRNIRRNLSIFNAVLCLKNDQIPIIWFNQQYIVDKLKYDPYFVVYGKLDHSKIESAFHVSSIDVCYSFKDTGDGKVFPQYQQFRGVSNTKLVNIIKEALQFSDQALIDVIPKKIIETDNLLAIKKALLMFHFPSTQVALEKARKRLAFDELFCYLFPRRIQYSTTKKIQNNLVIQGENKLVSEYLSRLPYSLTNAQQKVWQNIANDLAQSTCVFRLIQGDVGSGKTDVAILCLLSAYSSGLKGALLVPTEILAQQHFLKCKERCGELGIEIIQLKGKQKKKERAQILDRLASSDPLIVVGTHALIQDSIKIKKLGFVIIDEQHRFGVFQRQALLEKSNQTPHCLFMTATPIPRTLMLTHYGDLSHDLINELPPGRVPPNTYFGKLNKMVQINEFIRLELNQGRQAYVVYPLIEESEHLDLESAINGHGILSKEFEEFKVELLHGRMTNEEKKAVMDNFKENHIQVLVSTTVIEVGIDVPNASVMVIMNAERFGLSQLHQLRGRVGRGRSQSHCFLVADAKSIESKQRIKAMLDTSNGFELAEKDLKIRGPGNLLGTQQSGDIIFSFANLMDERAIKKMIKYCDYIIKNQTKFSELMSFLDKKLELVAITLN